MAQSIQQQLEERGFDKGSAYRWAVTIGQMYGNVDLDTLPPEALLGLGMAPEQLAQIGHPGALSHEIAKAKQEPQPQAMSEAIGYGQERMASNMAKNLAAGQQSAMDKLPASLRTDIGSAAAPTGEGLLEKILPLFSQEMGAEGITPEEIKQYLTGAGIDINKKGLKSSDILAALGPTGAGLSSNLLYKRSHPSPINSQQMQQLLGMIEGRQAPVLQGLQNESGIVSGIINNFAKYMPKNMAGAYGDLSKTLASEAHQLPGVIKAENPAAILGMISGGGVTAPATSGLAGLMAAAGVNPTTLTPTK